MKKPKVNAYGLKGWNLPPEVHKRVYWQVRDYARIKAEYDDLLTRTPSGDGQPKSKDPSDPTQAAAIKRAKLASDVEAIEKALRLIPKEDAEQIMRYLAQKKSYTVPAHRNTWANRMKPFFYAVAIYSGY